jgi:tetratricopeptide (TPR) repeat protein
MASSKLPSSASKKLGHANWLLSQNEPDEALRVVNDVLDEYPDNTEALHIAGRVYIAAKRFGMGYNLSKLAQQNAGNADADDMSALWNNLALCAMGVPGRNEEAERYVRKALKIDPKNAAAMNNLALLCVNECRPEEAVQWADKSLAVKPDQRETKETRGYACLMLGRYAEGWAGYETMLGGPYRKPKPVGDEPYWKGEKGIRLMVRGEQGIGDEVSFASMIPDALKENSLLIECDKRLEGLFRRSFPGVIIEGTRFEKQRGWTAEVDAHCLMGSLASKYRTKDEDFPGKPYLVADPERRDQWKLLLDRLPGMRVGIAWTGGMPNTFRDRRSARLEDLLPILQTRGCSFVSLQYKDPREEIAALKEKHGVTVHHYARATEAPDYDETAALVAELDLVITVTTAVVDLCGALGKPCWVMVPAKPHWRYGLKGDRKVWYGSVKLYRAKKHLTDCVEQIRGDLAAYLHRGGQSSTPGLHSPAVVDHRANLSTRCDTPAPALDAPDPETRIDGVHLQPLPAAVPAGLQRNRFIP